MQKENKQNEQTNERLFPLPEFPFLPKPFLYNGLSQLETGESELQTHPTYSKWLKMAALLLLYSRWKNLVLPDFKQNS